MSMAVALEARLDWLGQAAELRQFLDAAIEEAGGEVVARDSRRLPAITSYRMPGVASSVQLIQFDMAGIYVYAGSACYSGTLKARPVMTAMGWDSKGAGEVGLVSFGRFTSDAECRRLFVTLNL